MKKFILLMLLTIPLLAYFYFVPIFKPFPVLSGSYKVGLRTTEWVDNNRRALYGDKELPRSIVAHLWYPISLDSNKKLAPYLGEKMPLLQQAFSQVYKLPLWLSKILLNDIQSRSYIKADLSATQQQWPVIVFTHGLLGSPSDMYSALLEDLASHGYIVIGLDLPYFNFLTLHEDGKITSSAQLSAQFNKMSQDEQKQFMSKAIEIYKQDLGFAIDKLYEINKDSQSLFYNHLDLEHIGVIGHSAGGTAAIEFCRTDKRCKAAVNLDGWYDHIISTDPLPVPLLMVFGQKSVEITEPTEEYLQRKGLTKKQYYERENAIVKHKKQLCENDNCKMIIIPNAEHAAFGDEILLKWPFRAWHLGDAYTIINETNKLVVNFFDMYLKK